MAVAPPVANEERTSVVPLRKKTVKGKLYTRDAKVEAKLVELATLSREEIVARCTIHERDDGEYVPSECVLHFVRGCREDEGSSYFERLYKILADRVYQRLPKAERAGETVSLTASRVREHAFDRFLRLLMADRSDYSEKLDYYEIRFDSAMKRLRSDAFREVLPDAKRSTFLEVDQKTGEIFGEVERADKSFDPFSPSKLSSADYRFSLDAAIDVLTEDKRRIVEMIRLGIPIDSKESGVVTIAKALGKSEKTIRTYRDEAFAELSAWLTKGEQP